MAIDDLSKFLKENQGYIILVDRKVKDDEFVLGWCPRPMCPSPYVTWNKGDRGYDFGHYFSELFAATNDLDKRVREVEWGGDVTVPGHKGTWYAIDELVINDERYFLLEHEEYGDEAAAVVVNSHGDLIEEDVWDGFDDDMAAYLLEITRNGGGDSVKKYKNENKEEEEEER